MSLWQHSLPHPIESKARRWYNNGLCPSKGLLRASIGSREDFYEDTHTSIIDHGNGPISFRFAQNIDMEVGFQVWRAARILACFLEQHDICRNRTVLELGAGCGLVGILAAHLGAKVTLTDVDRVLAITRHNSRLNCGVGLQVDELWWGTDIRRTYRRGEFDLIIGSDLTYNEDLHGPLILTLLQLLSDQTDLLLAHTRRREKELDRWQARFERYFDVEVVLTESEAAEYVSRGWVSAARYPVSIYKISLHGPPPFEEDLTAVFKAVDGEHPEDLLTLLALTENDLQTIQVGDVIND